MAEGIMKDQKILDSISADSIYRVTGLIIFIAYVLCVIISAHSITLPNVPSPKNLTNYIHNKKHYTYFISFINYFP